MSNSGADKTSIQEAAAASSPVRREQELGERQREDHRLESNQPRAGPSGEQGGAAAQLLHITNELRELRRVVLACPSIAEACEPILETVLSTCRMDGGAIYLVEGDDAVLHVHRGVPPAFVDQVRTVSLQLPFVRHVLTTPGVINLTEAYPDRRRLHHAHGMQQVFAISLRGPRGVAGFLNLVSISTVGPESEQLAVLELVAWELETLLERYSAEEALRESQSRISSIFRAAPSGIGLVVDRVLLEVNERVSEMTGYTKQELLGESSRMLYPSDEEFERVGTQKYRQIRDHGTGTVETRWQRKDGSIMHVLLSSTALNPDDLSVGVTFSATDISELKQHEARLRRLRMAIDQASEVIVVTDPDGAISYVNPAFERITGYSTEEVLGKNPRILQSGVHDQEFYDELWGTLLSGKTWTGRLTNRRKNGDHYIEEATISPVRSPEGEIVSYVAVKRDITDELELQAQLQQAQKMEAVGLLAGGIAHDFNNIIQVILGYGEIIAARAELSEEMHDRLDKVIGAAERASDLITQLLAFSRRQVLKLAVVDLNRVVTNLLKMVRRVIGEHINLVVEPGDDLARVRVDVGQIEQILMNLVVNARDAMPEGGTICITTRNIELDEAACRFNAWASPGRYVLFSVADTGEGIAKEKLGLIFEPFYTTKQSGEGTGLGLAMVYGIVKQHGGLINATSTPGEGTAIEVYLPIAEVEPGLGTQQQLEQPDSRGGVETILLAEDEVAVREVASTLLEQAGYTVLVAEDGEAALAVFRERSEEISLTILDVVMPKLGGLAVYRGIRELSPEARVLFTTGYSATQLTDDIVSQPSVGMIAKPYRTRQLLGSVRQLLDDDLK